MVLLSRSWAVQATRLEVEMLSSRRLFLKRAGRLGPGWKTTITRSSAVRSSGGPLLPGLVRMLGRGG